MAVNSSVHERQLVIAALTCPHPLPSTQKKYQAVFTSLRLRNKWEMSQFLDFLFNRLMLNCVSGRHSP